MPPLFNAIQLQEQKFQSQFANQGSDEADEIESVSDYESGSDASAEELTEDVLTENNNITTVKPPSKCLLESDNQSGDDCLTSAQKGVSKRVRRWYNHRGGVIVWKNIILLNMLHCMALYGIYLQLFVYQTTKGLVVSYFYGVLTGLGVTSGAHRLWSHRAYKARLPMRIILMFAHCAAGQGHLIEWCRDHRTHHKYSETDADPHDSRRGYFFSHCGWLLTRKHPEVIRKGKQIDMSDLWADPVVRFQVRYYLPLAFFWCVFLPGAILHYACEEISWVDAIIGAGFWRYIIALHGTWFVNSAAHMWGDRPFNHKIAARQNMSVAFNTFGEGYHNYHHTFPYDYRASESVVGFNFTGVIIYLASLIGLTYDLRKASPEKIEKYRDKTHHHRFGHDGVGY